MKTYLRSLAFPTVMMLLVALGPVAAEDLKSRDPLEVRGWVVNAVAFSPDGKTLASGLTGYTRRFPPEGEIRLWDVAKGKNTATWEVGAAVKSVAFSPDGKTLALASDEKTIKLWDVATGKRIAIMDGHSLGVCSVAYSPDGKTLASGGADNTVKIWDVATRKNTATFGKYTPPQRLEASPYVNSVAFSPDGKTLAAGYLMPSWAGEIKLWDVAAGKEIASLEGHKFDAPSVAFSPDGKLLASGGDDRKVKIWDVGRGECLATLDHPGSVCSVSFGPDSNTLAAGCLTSLIFGPDSKPLGFGAEILLWDVARERKIAILKGHSKTVRSVQFSPDGKLLASGAWDETIRIWDLPPRQKPNR